MTKKLNISIQSQFHLPVPTSYFKSFQISIVIYIDGLLLFLLFSNTWNNHSIFYFPWFPWMPHLQINRWLLRLDKTQSKKPFCRFVKKCFDFQLQKIRELTMLGQKACLRLLSPQFQSFFAFNVPSFPMLLFQMVVLY